MNSKIGISSCSLSSASSSPSGDEDILLINCLMDLEEEQDGICRMMAGNNMILAHYLSHQYNQVTHGGLVPGHVVINRDRELADRNLFFRLLCRESMLQ